MAKPPRKMTDSEYKTLAQFRYTLRRFLRFSEEAGAAGGLTPQQYQALLAIRGFPAKDCVTVGELGERLQLQPHSVVGLLDRLAARGWVTRQTSETDRRRVHICLTRQGRKLLEQVATEHRSQLTQVGPDLIRSISAICRR